MNWAVVVKEWAHRVLGGQGVRLQGPRGSKGRPIGPQGVNGWGGQGVGLPLQSPRGSRGRPTGSQGIEGWAYKVLEGPTGQGCISCGMCSYPELTKDHVLTSAYVRNFRTVTRNAVNKSV